MIGEIYYNMIKLNKNGRKEIVVKGNIFIEGLNELGALELKLLNKIITSIDSMNDDDFKTYTFDKKELMEYLKLHKNYEELRSLIKRIPYKKAFLLKDKCLSTCYWFHADVYEHTIEFRLDPKLKPYLLKLEENFTQYELSLVTDFTCKYSFKTYEVFLMNYNRQKKYKKTLKVTLDIRQLRKMYFIKNKYKDNSAFIQKVIVPSIEEINKFTNIYIKYKEEFIGKSIVAVNFEVAKNNIANIKNADIEIFKTLWKMYPLRKGMNKIEYATKLEICQIGEEKFSIYINRYIQYVNERRKEFPNFNYMEGDKFFNGGYIDYTDENYQEYKAKKNINKPEQSNFEQREYDDAFFDSLYDN